MELQMRGMETQLAGEFKSLQLVLCQNLKLGLSVIPAQAGIPFPPSLDPRLRGDDEPENQMLTKQ